MHRYILGRVAMPPAVSLNQNCLSLADERARQTTREVHRLFGIQPAGLMYEFKPRIGDDPSLAALISALPKNQHVGARCAIFTIEPEIDYEPLPEHPNLVVVNAKSGRESGGWKPTGKPRISALVETPTSLLPLLAQDLLIDIMIANSKPITDVLHAAIDDMGRENLYRRKVTFLARRGIKTTFYGGIDPAVGYVSFAAAARHSLDDPRAHANEMVELWDAFITEDLGRYCLRGQALLCSLRKRRGTGGQMSPEKLTTILNGLAPGMHYVARVGRRPGTPEGQQTVTIALQIPSWSRRHLVCLSRDDFIRHRTLIQDNRIEITPFYVGAGSAVA